MITTANGFDQDRNEKASVIALLCEVPIHNNASDAGVRQESLPTVLVGGRGDGFHLQFGQCLHN